MFQSFFVMLLLAWQGPVAAPPASTVQPASNIFGGRPSLRCGAEALYFGLKWLDLPVANFQELEAKLGPPTGLGYSMADLEAAARQFGATTLGVETTLEALTRRPGPLVRIARMKSGHFVNIIGERDGMVEIINPPAREDQIPRETFTQLWDGKVLLLSTAPMMKEEDLPRPFSWGIISGLAIGVILALILVLRWRQHA